MGAGRQPARSDGRSSGASKRGFRPPGAQRRSVRAARRRSSGPPDGTSAGPTAPSPRHARRGSAATSPARAPRPATRCAVAVGVARRPAAPPAPRARPSCAGRGRRRRRRRGDARRSAAATSTLDVECRDADLGEPEAMLLDEVEAQHVAARGVGARRRGRPARPSRPARPVAGTRVRRPSHPIALPRVSSQWYESWRPSSPSRAPGCASRRSRARAAPSSGAPARCGASVALPPERCEGIHARPSLVRHGRAATLRP